MIHFCNHKKNKPRAMHNEGAGANAQKKGLHTLFNTSF